MRIENYLSPYCYKTYEQLRHETGKTDRTIRNDLSDLKLNVPVLYTSSSKGNGFRLVKPIANLTKAELKEELEEVKHTRNDIHSRRMRLEATERTYNNKIFEIEFAIKQIELSENQQLELKF